MSSLDSCSISDSTRVEGGPVGPHVQEDAADVYFLLQPSKVLEASSAGQTVCISSHLCTQRRHAGSLKPFVMGTITPRKPANATNRGVLLCVHVCFIGLGSQL